MVAFGFSMRSRLGSGANPTYGPASGAAGGTAAGTAGVVSTASAGASDSADLAGLAGLALSSPNSSPSGRLRGCAQTRQQQRGEDECG